MATTTAELNPRETIGNNVPDYAAEELRRLNREFDGIENDIIELLNAARALPETVETQETADDYTTVISRFKDLDNKVEALRVSEGLPWLRKTEAVNSFFFSKRERLLRRKKTDAAGGGDVLHSRLHAYNERRLAEEQRIRDEAARAARIVEEKARAERERLEREQREAEERAARARNAGNKAKAEAAAREAAAAAESARQAEEADRSKRAEAEANAAAKPADLVRERHSGAMNTMRREGFAEIVDPMKLDAIALWPFVKDDAKLAALKAWAKTTQHQREMPGARIGFRNDTVVKR